MSYSTYIADMMYAIRCHDLSVFLLYVNPSFITLPASSFLIRLD